MNQILKGIDQRKSEMKGGCKRKEKSITGRAKSGGGLVKGEQRGCRKS